MLQQLARVPIAMLLRSMTIGKTVKIALHGDVETSYSALILSQSKYKTDSLYRKRLPRFDLTCKVVRDCCQCTPRRRCPSGLSGRLHFVTALVPQVCDAKF